MRLALVALASLVAGAATTGLAAVAWEPPEPGVSVPTGNYGDTIEYATHWQLDEIGPTPRHAVLDGMTRWTIDEARTPDQAGQLFDSVRVRETFSAADGTARSSQAFVDLHLRSIKRVDLTQAYQGAIELADIPTDNQATLTVLGPSFVNVGTLPDPRFAALVEAPSSPAALLQLQGRRLAEGMAWSVASGAGMDAEQRVWGASVRQVGQADGAAVAVVELRADGHAAWVNTPRLQSDWSLFQNQFAWNVTVWMSEDSPYPVRVEETLQQMAAGGFGQARVHVRRTMSLVDLSAGALPIPWGMAAGPETPPTIDWTPGPIPFSGDWRGPMSLEAGLAAASAPQLVGFAAWKADHPDHRLVGFYLRIVAPEMTPTLSLFFGAPSSANLFYVVVEQRPGPSLVAREGLAKVEGVTTHPIVQPYVQGPDVRHQVAAMIEWTPGEWPSLGSLEERWGLVANDQAFEAGPNSVQWGLQCQCALDEAQLRQAASTIRFGRWTPAAPTDSPLENRGAWDHAMFDAFSGDLRSARSSSMAFQSPSLATGSSVQAPPSLGEPGSPLQLDPWVVGFSASALVALVLSWKTLRSAGIVLYARLLPAQLLSHPVRQQFLESIRATPGIGAPRLSQMHGIPWSTTMHHLRRMAAAGYITSERDGRHRRYFAGKTDAQTRKVLAVIQNERTRYVLDLIRDNPGIHRTALATKCNVSVPGVLWHLDRLAGAGLIRSNRSGRAVLYFRNEGPVALLGSAEASAIEAT